MRYEKVEKEKSEKKSREKAYELWCNCDSVAEFKIKLATMIPEMSVFPFLVHYFWKMHMTTYCLCHTVACIVMFLTIGPVLVVLAHLPVFISVLIAFGVPAAIEWIWEVKVSKIMRELARYECIH